MLSCALDMSNDGKCWNVFESIGWVTSKTCNGRTVSLTKTSGERAHRYTFRYKMECIIRTENTA